MYDWPVNRVANDAFWAGVVRHLGEAGIEAPSALARNADPDASWTDPDLLLGQTCGMPFVCGHCGDARVVARPDYGLPAASGGDYRSVIVVRAGDAARPGAQSVLAWGGRRAAVNEWRSFSGHVALRAHLAKLRSNAREPFFGPFFNSAAISGSHLDSARMVAYGEADMAALDGVAWAMLQAHEPGTAERLAVLEMTVPAPALPYITAPRFDAIRPALAAALAGAAQSQSPAAGLPRSVVPADDGDYRRIRELSRVASAERFAPGAPEMSEL